MEQRGLSQSKGPTSNFIFFGSVNLQESAEKYERVLLTGSFSEKIHLIACDLSNSKDIENLYKKTLEIGFVECIISNSGLGRFSSIDQMIVEDWDVQINTNL